MKKGTIKIILTFLILLVTVAVASNYELILKSVFGISGEEEQEAQEIIDLLGNDVAVKDQSV